MNVDDVLTLLPPGTEYNASLDKAIREAYCWLKAPAVQTIWIYQCMDRTWLVAVGGSMIGGSLMESGGRIVSTRYDGRTMRCLDSFQLIKQGERFRVRAAGGIRADLVPA